MEPPESEEAFADENALHLGAATNSQVARILKESKRLKAECRLFAKEDHPFARLAMYINSREEPMFSDMTSPLREVVAASSDKTAPTNFVSNPANGSLLDFFANLRRGATEAEVRHRSIEAMLSIDRKMWKKQIRIAVVGEPGSGKSCFVRQWRSTRGLPPTPDEFQSEKRRLQNKCLEAYKKVLKLAVDEPPGIATTEYEDEAKVFVARADVGWEPDVVESLQRLSNDLAVKHHAKQLHDAGQIESLHMFDSEFFYDMKDEQRLSQLALLQTSRAYASDAEVVPVNVRRGDKAPADFHILRLPRNFRPRFLAMLQDFTFCNILVIDSCIAMSPDPNAFVRAKQNFQKISGFARPLVLVLTKRDKLDRLWRVAPRPIGRHTHFSHVEDVANAIIDDIGSDALLPPDFPKDWFRAECLNGTNTNGNPGWEYIRILISGWIQQNGKSLKTK